MDGFGDQLGCLINMLLGTLAFFAVAAFVLSALIIAGVL